VEKEAIIPEAEISEDTTEYLQIWPALTRVESNLSGTSLYVISTWQLEVSLQRRNSTPELRKLLSSA
jgi:hypothetical protein